MNKMMSAVFFGVIAIGLLAGLPISTSAQNGNRRVPTLTTDDVVVSRSIAAGAVSSVGRLRCRTLLNGVLWNAARRMAGAV